MNPEDPFKDPHIPLDSDIELVKREVDEVFEKHGLLGPHRIVFHTLAAIWDCANMQKIPMSEAARRVACTAENNSRLNMAGELREEIRNRKSKIQTSKIKTMNLQAILSFREELVAKHNLDLAACDRLLGKSPSETLVARALPLDTAGTIRRRPPLAPAPSPRETARRPAGSVKANVSAAIARLPARWGVPELCAALPKVKPGHIRSTLARMVKAGELGRTGKHRETVFFASGTGPAKAAAPSADPEIERRQKNYEEIRGSIHVPRDVNAGNYE